jgi:molybdopterin synthase sulfur carrier subunit
VNGERSVEADGATVRDVLDDLTSRYPALRGQVFEGEGIAPFINVFLEKEDVRTLDGLDTSVKADSTLMLLPAMAGGA